MAKFIIKWDAGLGDSHEEIEAENQDAADMIAYEAWKEEAETNANYSAELWTEELAEELCL